MMSPNTKTFTFRRFSKTAVLRHLFLTLVLLSGGFRISEAQKSDMEAVPGVIMFKIASEEERRAPSSQILALPASEGQILRDVEATSRIFGLEEVSRFMPETTLRELERETMFKGRFGGGDLRLPDDLGRTYRMTFSAPLDPGFVASKVRQIPGVVYAEPRYLAEITSVPNDSLFGTSGNNYFAYQRFPQAWEVSTSSEEIIIAIVDSGVDYNHPDLRNKLWRNPEPGRARELFPNIFSEVVNDTIGWNFWESGPITNPVQNGNPIGTFQVHGTHVAGIAAASTNNGIGVASAGYNSRFMAVRAGGTQASPRTIAFGFEGILYAAINGAHVINCSFGSESFSQFGLDVVEFATALGSVIIASAGNGGNESLFYPAAYPEVLSVASVINNSGTKSGFSSYYYEVDVSATGSNILSTIFNNRYGLSSGTSMSAPVVSGLAALIRHQNPEWTPHQVIGQIRGTANPSIYSNPSNFNFIDKLGRGVIDAGKAMQTPVPYVRVLDVDFLNLAGGKLGMDEDGIMRVQISNFGEPVNGLYYFAEGTSLAKSATISSSGLIGTLARGDTTVIEISLRFSGGELDPREVPTFKLTFEDNNAVYSDSRFIRYSDFFVDTHEINRVTLSFSSNGGIGFASGGNAMTGEGFVPVVERDGMLIRFPNLLYESGLMIEYKAEDEVHLISNVRETSFTPLEFKPVELFGVRTTADTVEEGTGRFNSGFRPDLPGLSIEQKTFAYNAPGLENVVFVYYTLRNTDEQLRAYSDVYVGLYTDWDLGNYLKNSVWYSESDSLQVVSGAEESYPVVTVAHLGGLASAFAINNAYTGPADSLNFGVYFSPGSGTERGFLPQYKSWSLKAGLGKTTQSDTDISMVSSSGPFAISPGESVTTGFIYAFGADEAELREQVANARELNPISVTPNHNEPATPTVLPTETALVQNYPNPFNNRTNIVFELARDGYVEVDLYDLTGRKVDSIFSGQLYNRRYVIPYEARNLASGVYLVVMRTDFGEIKTRKIMLLK